MVNYKVGDKVRILDVEAIASGDAYWKNGDVREVLTVTTGGSPRLSHYAGGVEGLLVLESEFHAIELVESATPKPTKKARIEALEQRVEELERKFSVEPTPSDAITSVNDVKLGDKIAVEEGVSIYLRFKSSYEVVAVSSENSNDGEQIVVLDDEGDIYELTSLEFAKLRKVAS